MRKRISQTIKIALALFVAVFANGMIPSAVAYATVAPEDTVTNITEPVTPPVEVTTPQEEVTEPEAEFVPLSSFTPANEETSQSLLFQRPTYKKEVTPKEPTKNDICGTNGDTYTIPSSEGVEYYLKKNGRDKLLEQGKTYSTHGDSQLTIIAIAEAKHGYELKGKKEWNLQFNTDKCKVTICHRTASASNPYVKIEVDDDAVNGKSNGDHYLEHTGPIFPDKDEHGKWGDIIPPLPGVHSGLNWLEGQALLEDDDCIVPATIDVTTGPCAYYNTTSWAKINLSGTTKNATLVVKDSEGIIVGEWKIKTDKEGEVTSPSLPVELTGLSDGNYTVELLSKEGVVIKSSSFTIELCKYVVTPKAPKIIDLCYGDKDMIYIKYTKGILYKVNGYVKTGWVSYTGTTLEVTAEAAPGYELGEGAITSWTFDDTDFTDEQCLTIVKTGIIANDTNEDGVIGVGDTVTWEITVTNTGDKSYENFYVTVEDEDATLENDGLVGYLGAGESVTLEATSILTAEDLQACKATNTATFFGWRAHKPRNDALSLYSNDNEKTVKSPLATGSDSAELAITCPTPGSGGNGGPETPGTPVLPTPDVLPATGPAPVGSPLLALAAAAIAYGATFFLQQRRNLSAQTASKQ